MAAQKLTKARLTQIIAIFIVLLTAFFWRGYHYEIKSKSSVECQINEPCPIRIEKMQLDVTFSDFSPYKVMISLDSKEKSRQSLETITIESALLKPNKMNLKLRDWIIDINLPMQSEWLLSIPGGESILIKLNKKRESDS